MATASDHDYTAETPFDTNVPDIDFFQENGGAIRAHEMSSSDIEASGSLNMPLGWQLVTVNKFAEPPKEVVKAVNLNGNPATGMEESYTSLNLALELGNVYAPSQTIRHYVLFPPKNPAELRAYFEGCTVGDGKIKKQSKGYQSRLFFQTMAAMGFEYPPGGFLPKEACNTANWWGRRMLVLIVPREGTRFNQIANFKYRPIGPHGKAADGGKAALAAARAELESEGGIARLLGSGSGKPGAGRNGAAPVASTLVAPDDTEAEMV